MSIATATIAHSAPSSVPSYIADMEAADRALMEVLCAEYEKAYKEYEEICEEYDEQYNYIRSQYNGWDEPERGELADYNILFCLEKAMEFHKKEVDMLEAKIDDQRDKMKERYELGGEWLDGEGVDCHDCGHDQMIKACLGCSRTVCAGCHFLCHDCKWGEYA
jgi:hypothetical protein